MLLNVINQLSYFTMVSCIVEYFDSLFEMKYLFFHQFIVLLSLHEKYQLAVFNLKVMNILVEISKISHR